MSNTNNINNLILELDKIDSLYREANAINKEIQNLPNQKKQEESRYQGILNDDEKSLVKKQIEELPPLYRKSISDYVGGIGGGVFWAYPPDHWENAQIKPEKKYEGYIEEGLNCEFKEKFYEFFRNYDEHFLTAVKECDNLYANALARKQNNLDKIAKEYATKEKDLTDRKNHLEQQLNGITLLSQDLFADAARISTMLKQKRAETLKEAINLAFDEKRKDEEELRRRNEAAYQEYLLEEQLRENRKHNEAMERVAQQEALAIREHNAAMERTAQTQADSQKRANEARCLSCAKSGTCSYERKQANICQSYIRR